MVERVRRLKGSARELKLELFLKRELPNREDFLDRQLNDTRYASRLAVEYLATLYGGQIIDGKRVVYPTAGRITAYLRQRWNLNSLIGHADQKNRADHRHHAIDALVTALSNPAAVQTLARAAERAEQTRSGLFAEVDPPFPDLLEQARLLVDQMKISSRVNRKVNGPLHKESIQSRPIVTGMTSKGEPIVEHHMRKSLASMSSGEVNDIVDPTIRRLVQEKLHASGKEPKDTFQDDSQLPAIKDKNGRKILIRKAKIRMSGNPIQVGSGSKSRYVHTGDNHHMAVVALIDGDGKEVRWEGHIVTRFEAISRKQRKEPVIQSDFGPNKKFKFALFGGDYLLLDREGQMDQLCRIVVISGSKLELVLHSNANPATVRKKAIGERIYASVGTLPNMNARKVEVDSIGNVFGKK